MKTLLSEEKTQMASTPFGQNGECSNSAHVENHRETEVAHGAADQFGEPEILPRIGDEYQAELPQLVESRPRKRTRFENLQSVLVGLPIMLTWINTLKNLVPGSQSRSRTMAETLEELHDLPTAEDFNNHSGRGFRLVPGLVHTCWNALEKESLVLGLYIFEKNFVEVRRFVGTKGMGAILSFYYGSFYGSRDYHKWSECRKTKGKKGIYGQRMFSGARQQEFLSRILAGVSEECRNAVLEVSKAFGDDKMSLSDYIFSLRDMVGVKTLVDAVGIGKGKFDLTEMHLDSSRSNARPEIPTGKALSALSTDEIIKLLSGAYRLSKTRSNDIFWDAVWPRLLARGWHSEQPESQGFTSRHGLVFLRPGIKKFSRKDLVKGRDYFDSLADVLGKVAKEPELIDLDSVGGCSGTKDASASHCEKNSEKGDDDLEKRQRHFYLQPRMPNRNGDVIKFTIVDTSLPNGKIRGLRTFSSEFSNMLVPLDGSDDSDEDASLEKSDESDRIDTTAKSDKKTARDPKRTKDVREKSQTKKVSKSLPGRRAKPDSADCTGPIAKRCRTLTACSQEVTNAHPSGVNEVTENLSSQAGASRDQTSNAGPSGVDPGENAENARPQILIDLNLPVPPDPENPELGQAQDNGANGPDNNALREPPANEAQAQPEQPLNLNHPRRLSTRNRPPTQRALEAVADGYLTVHRRRRARGNENPAPRPGRRAGAAAVPIEPAHDPVAPQAEEDGENAPANSGNSNVAVEEPRVPPNANEDSGAGR